jgi:hypothetical protein
MLSKKIIVVLLVVVVALVALGIWLGMAFLNKGNPAGPSDYSAVYLVTGDIYFGKLQWFPKPHLTNVWFLQRGVNQQNQPQLNVAPFNAVFWGPVDEIYLNPSEIIFWTSLRNDSQLAKALANPASVQPLAPQGQLPAPSAAATGTAPLR